MNTKLRMENEIKFRQQLVAQIPCGKLSDLHQRTLKDTLIKEEDDKATIGILLCREKNNIEAEFALRDINKPMGVSEFELTQVIPENLQSSLPTIEELESNLLNHD